MKIAAGKTTIPGKTNVLRAIQEGECAGDIIVRQDDDCVRYGKTDRELVSYRLNSPERQVKKFAAGTEVYPLLKDMVKNGKVIAEDMNYGIEKLRQTAASGLSMLGTEYKRLKNPHVYGVGQEAQIELRQQELIRQFQK